MAKERNDDPQLSFEDLAKYADHPTIKPLIERFAQYGKEHGARYEAEARSFVRGRLEQIGVNPILVALVVNLSAHVVDALGEAYGRATKSPVIGEMIDELTANQRVELFTLVIEFAARTTRLVSEDKNKVLPLLKEIEVAIKAIKDRKN